MPSSPELQRGWMWPDRNIISLLRTDGDARFKLQGSGSKASEPRWVSGCSLRSQDSAMPEPA